MAATLADYEAALSALAATVRDAASRELGCDLPPVRVEVHVVAPGREQLATDYVAAVHLAVSDLAQLLPPPAGANTIYGVCHEVGHLIVAHAVPGGAALPVIWDEALAHLLAVDVLLPAVWDAHGQNLWPDHYPDYLERETALPDEPTGHLHGSVASLRRLTGELRAVSGQVGAAGLLAALAAVPSDQWRAHTLGPALRRAAATRG